MNKLKTNFALKSVKGTNKPVLLILNFGYKVTDALSGKTIYKPLRYYTGIAVSNEQWDKSIKLPRNENTIRELLEVKRVAEDVYNYLVLDGKEVTPELIKDELDVKLNRKEKQKKIVRIGDYINEVILKASEGRSSSTLKSYNGLSNKIAEFELKKNIVLTIDNLDREMYLEFSEFVKSKVNKINSVWSVLKVFKTTLKEIALNYKVEVFNPTTGVSKRNQVQATTEEKVYFTFDQIAKILAFKTNNERLRNTKQILVTLLFTGCRYSDVFKIKPDFKYEKNGLTFEYARYISSKTNIEIVCPILKPLQKSYLENDNKPPYKISDVKFNKYVKELIKLCAIDQEVTCSYTDSHGQKQFETKSFYQFVSSHIGRRSFITNLINYVPITILSKVTGHTIKDKSIIFGYNKISLIDNAAVFVKELKRIAANYKEDFPIQLV